MNSPSFRQWLGKSGKEVGRSYQRLLRDIEEIRPAKGNLKDR